MEKNQLESFDICIVCALPEEVRAFLEILRSQSESAIEEGTSSRYQYPYRIARIKNRKDELLTLHISWLSRYGPHEMTLHLDHVLEECQPRIAIMTGICAGDAQCVQLGDLIVAERTFTYDNGKFTRDEQGQLIHEHDTQTYQLDTNILQFLWLFDEWKPLVADLKRPPSPSGQQQRRGVECHIKPMASGNAVRADNPFEDVRAPVRGTVAIDMECAAFGLVANRHPLIPWLVVKGVCDYADQDKNDAYHDYTARASAIYALSFIRAYVIKERLPRPDGLSIRARPSRVRDKNHPLRQNLKPIGIITGCTIVLAFVMIFTPLHTILPSTSASSSPTTTASVPTTESGRTPLTTPTATPLSIPIQDFAFPPTWKAVPALSFSSPYWENDRTTPGCSYTAGIYQVVSTGLNTCEYGGSDIFSPTDIAVRMEVSILSGQWAGLKIRSRNNNYYLFQINSDGTLRFALHDAGDDHSIPASWRANRVIFGQSQWTTIQIVAHGSRFYLSINGQPAFAGTDSTLQSGTVGVAVGYGDNISCTAQFRNLQVEVAS